MRPHRWQPTRLPRPWDSPGKNNGVGCHFLLQCMKVKSESEVTQSCPTLRDPMDCSLPGSSIHGIFQARVLEWGAIAFSIIYIQIYSYLAEGFLPYLIMVSSYIDEWLKNHRVWKSGPQGVQYSFNIPVPFLHSDWHFLFRMTMKVHVPCIYLGKNMVWQKKERV